MKLAAQRLAFVAVAAVIHASAEAQSPPVRVGNRVRVTAPTLGLIRQPATLVAFVRDTMVLAVRVDSAVVRCALDAVTDLDVSRGQRPNTREGTVLGFLAGAGLGALVGLAIGGSGERSAVDVTAFTAGAGALAGLVIGARVGTMHRRELWEPVTVRDLDLVPDHR